MSRRPSFVGHQARAYSETVYIPEIAEYRAWLKNHRRTGYVFEADSARQTHFFFDADIQDYFNCDTDNSAYKVSKLLNAATKVSAVQADDVARDCPMIFSILLTIGQQQYIDHFVSQENLHDESLPFTSDDDFPLLPNGETFWKEFYAEQWRYCVKKLKYSLAPVTFKPNMILPIESIDELSQRAGASAVVRKVKIHAQYDGLMPRSASQSQLKAPTSNDLHVYVIKSYHSRGAGRYFDAEVRAFKVLNRTTTPPPNIVGFYKPFKQNETLHIVLQYANIGTLEDYFKKCERPTLGHDIINLWTKLFKLNDAVDWIHRSRGTDDDKQRDNILLGWHQDIKPANILVIGDLDQNPYQVELMLADLGLSHFTTTLGRNNGLSAEEMPGVRDYGAPERNLRPSQPLLDYTVEEKQKFDIWGLACVYSEFSVWIVQGAKGLEAFREARMREVAAPDSGAVFHNKEGAVLETVRSWHQDQLLHRHANEDRITPLFWDEFCYQLFTDTRVRPNIAQVQWFSKRLLEKAQQTRSLKRVDTAPASVPNGAVEPDSPPHTPPEIPSDIPSDENDLPLAYPWTPPQDQKGESSQPNPFPGTVNSTQGPGRFNTKRLSPPVAPAHVETNQFGGYPSEVEGIPWQRHESARGDAHRPTHLPHLISEIALADRSQQPDLQGTHELRYGLIHSDTHYEGVPGRAGQQPEYQSAEHRYHLLNASEIDTESTAQADKVASHVGAERDSQRTGAAAVKQKSPRKSPKELGVKELADWYVLTRESKPIFGRGRERTLPHEIDLLWQLKRRDHIFIIDDSKSMKPYWKSLETLTRHLLYFIKYKRLDPNGSRVICMHSGIEKEDRNTTPLLQVITTAGQRLTSETDFAAKLDQVLSDYIKKLSRNGEQRPISIYVLTNGVWKRGSDDQEDFQLSFAERAILRTVNGLEDLRAQEKMVGIQLIRFGDDAKGIERMEHLDAGLKKKHKEKLGRDICDTEPANGNVWKMLLGSIDPYWDND